jgi:outer membrane receptor protein involved in Fe transport
VAIAAALLVLPVVSAQPLRAQDSTSAARRDSVARLHPVNIVAAPAERSEPVGATHVDAATVRLTPSSTPYELLRQAAGVEVHQSGQGPGFASDASLRGFSSDHSTDLALWIDGVPINEPVNGHAEGYNDFSLLFPAGIQDIDVIRGPTSALFGNFALAGVVNVRTIERMRGTSVSATAGSFGRAEALVLTGFDHGARGGGVAGLRVQREDGFRPNAGNSIVQGHFRLVHDLTPTVRIDGGAELYGGNWNSPGFLSEDEFIRHDYDVVSNPSDGGFKRRAQERVSLRMFAGSMLWRSTAYATQGRWQLFLTIPPAGGQFEGSGSQTEEEDSRDGVGATSALTWSLPRGEVTVGGETRWDRSHYQNWFTTTRMRDSAAALVTASQLSGALFAQGHTDLTTRLRLTLGARYDALDTRSEPLGEASSSATHGVFSPKVGALLKVTNAVGVYANLSRGFRSSDGIITDPTLTPITAWAYEAGMKLDHGGAMASAALFRMDVSNEQTFNPVTLESSSGGSSRRQGVELDWTLPLGRVLATSGNWTFNDARYTSLTAVPEEGDGPPEVLNGLRVYNTARYVGAAALDVAPPATWWRLRVSGNWVGPYSPFDEPGVVLGSYGLAHVAFMAQLRKVELDAGVAGHIVAPGRPRAVYVTAHVRV